MLHTGSLRVARFEDFEVGFQDGELRKQGLGIKLQQKALQVLEMLAEHPGLIVTREELQKKRWPASTPVDCEEHLDHAIDEVREALGDSPDRPRFIEVLGGRGYRFTVPVEWTDTGPPPQTIGRFRVVEKLGAGGMGVVYRRVTNAWTVTPPSKFCLRERSLTRRRGNAFVERPWQFPN